MLPAGNHRLITVSLVLLFFFFFFFSVSHTAHTPGYTQNMHKGLEVDEKSSAETCRNIHTQAWTHTNPHPLSHTENDELQWVLVCKQIGMKDCSDHRLAMHCFSVLFFFYGGGTWFSFVLACKIQTAENETRVSVLARRRAACIFIAAYFAAWHLKGAVLCASSNAAASSRCLTVGGGLFCMQLTWPCTIALGWYVCICAFLQKKTCVFKVWVRHRSGLTYIILCDHTQTHRM